MTTTQQQQERRALNEGIESSFIAAAGYAASIKTHFQTGRGAINDLYEDFYFNVAILFELTSDLEEMMQSRKEIDAMQGWLNKTGDSISSKNISEHCLEGMARFKDYKIALSRNGLLSLPARGR
jgi:hypothetical protein